MKLHCSKPTSLNKIFYLRCMTNNFVSIADIISEFRDELIHQYGENETLQFIYILFEYWKGMTRSDVHLNGRNILADTEVMRFKDALDQLKRNRPIQYIVGETRFHDLRIITTPAVLIPRPETEELVTLAVNEIKKSRNSGLSLLDIGTGSGCIAISMKKLIPSLDVTAVDISPDALNIAAENAGINGCEIQFIHSDILSAESCKEFPEYDVIISNPPYVTESEKKKMDKNVLDFEPSLALFVPDSNPLLFYKAIAEFALLHLTDNGKLFMEINEQFGLEIRELLTVKGFKNVEIINDIHAKPRFVKACC